MSETLVSKASVDSLEGGMGNGYAKKERNYSNGNGKFKRDGEPRPVSGPLAKAIVSKQAEISAVTAQINTIDAELKRFKESNFKLSPEKEARQAELNDLNVRRRNAYDAKNDIFKELTSVKDELKRERDHSKAKSRELKSVDSLAREIQELEEKIESAAFSVNEEKKLIQEISKLRKAKRSAEELIRTPAQDPVKILEARQRQIEVRLSEARQIYDQVDAEWKATEEERKALKDERDSSMKKNKELFALKDRKRDELGKLKEQREDLRKELNDLYDENRKKNDEQRKLKKIMGEVKDIEYEIKKLLNQKSKVHFPLSQEKESAQAVITYIKQKLSLDDSSASTLAKPSSAGLNIRKVEDSAALNLPKGVKAATVFKKPELPEDDFFKSMKKNPKTSASTTANGAVAKTTNNANTPLKLEFQLVSAFSKIGVSVPTTFGDLQGALKAAELKLADFEKKSQQLKADLESKSAAFDEEIAKLEKSKDEKLAEYSALKKSNVSSD